jgi:carbonic anhydrase/acetyltransferase-like protein (isoleucine patch superfamily)
MSLIPFEGHAPRSRSRRLRRAGRALIGDIEIGPEASVWYNCVLRGDMNRIRIGARSNVQDGTVIHVDPPRVAGPDHGYPALIGEDVLIGHMAMVHGCTLRDRAFVGLGAIVMDGLRDRERRHARRRGDADPGQEDSVGPALGGPSGQVRSATFVRRISR